jgi:acetyl-CoA C-acetyltransferase
MATDPRTPVLVGAGTITQRSADPREALDAVGLMVEAARRAADDAGSADLLGSVQWIGVPDGTWEWSDPAGLLAQQLGCDARTVLAEVGVLQHALWWRACALIAAGDLDVALVAGGEAKHREQQAARAGIELDPAEESGRSDERWSTDDVGISDHELERGLHQPAVAYALMEQAVGHALGRTAEDHRQAVGRLWERFGAVATRRADAWDRSAPTAEEIISASPDNRMVARPYTRQLCSQWNVDQAGALLLCSVDAARRFGIAEERWVFPVAMTENNTTEPMTVRPQLHRLTGAQIAGRRALDLADVEPDQITSIDLYSCFPAAVEIYAAELGLALDRQLTVTGGMTFGGGPFNNYVIQSTAEIARVLRDEPGTVGLVTNASGFVAKQGFDLWSTNPPSSRLALEDVSDEVARSLRPLDLDPTYSGPATIATWTVGFTRGEPWEAVAVVDTPDGRRALARSQNPEVLAALSAGDWIGSSIELASDGNFAPT